jgi:hypothetical protein
MVTETATATKMATMTATKMALTLTTGHQQEQR